MLAFVLFLIGGRNPGRTDQVDTRLECLLVGLLLFRCLRDAMPVLQWASRLQRFSAIVSSAR